jgi:hypothetical protein
MHPCFLEPLGGFDRQQSNPQAIPGRQFASNPAPFSSSPPPFGITPPFATEGNYSLGSQNSGSALMSYAKRGSGVYGVSPGDGRLSPTPGMYMCIYLRMQHVHYVQTMLTQLKPQGAPAHLASMRVVPMSP